MMIIRRVSTPPRLPRVSLFSTRSFVILLSVLCLATPRVRAAVVFFDSFELKRVGTDLPPVPNMPTPFPEIGAAPYQLNGAGTFRVARPADDSTADVAVPAGFGLVVWGKPSSGGRWERFDFPGSANAVAIVPQVQTGAEASAAGLPVLAPAGGARPWSVVTTSFYGGGGSCAPGSLDLAAAYPAWDETRPFHLEVHWNVTGPTTAELDVRAWNGDVAPLFAPSCHVVYTLAAGAWMSPARAGLACVDGVAEAQVSALAEYDAAPVYPMMVAATDPSISYGGRWATMNGAERHATNAGQRFRFLVTGDWCYLRVRGTGDAGTAPPISYRVDNGPWSRVQMETGADREVRIYDGTAGWGPHAVEVIVSGSWWQDAWSTEYSRFMLQGLSLAPGGSVSPLPYPARKVVFAGDSISCGYMLLPTPVSANASGQMEARLSPPELAAEWLGIDPINLSVPGMGFCTPHIAAIALPFLQNVVQGVPWTPETQPEAVVINLGTNDWNRDAYPDAVLSSTVKTYLQGVRAMFPHAPIYMLRPFNTPRDVVIRAGFDLAADPNSQWVDTAGWINIAAGQDTTDGIHPNLSGSTKYAQHLVALLSAPWQPPSSVAQISDPKAGDAVCGVVDVTGTAAGAGYGGYQVDYGAGAAPAAWKPITSGAAPVQGGRLASWDVSGLPLGMYTLRLTSNLASGPVSATSAVFVRLPGDADEDGTVTVCDAALLMKVAAGLAAEPGRTRRIDDIFPIADGASQPTGDGRADILDAIQVLRQVSGGGS